MDLSSLELRVTAEPGVRALNQYDAAASRAHRSNVLLDNAVAKLSTVFAAFSLVRVAAEAVALADSYANLNARLALVSRTSGELAANQAKLFAIAQESQQAYEGVATLFTRVARASGELGASQRELMEFTEGVSLALRVSGQSSESASGALLQLSQAIGAGVVRAEEFNSILEGAPRIAQAAADGWGATGVSIARLRAMVVAGEVSSKEFFAATLKGMASVKAEAATLPATVGGAFTQLQNAVLLYVGEANKAIGVTENIAGALRGLATNLDAVVEAAQALAVVFGARLLAGGIDTITAYSRSLIVARAETLAYAEASVRVVQAKAAEATAETAAVVAREAALKVTLQEIAAQRALEVQLTARLRAEQARAAGALANPAIGALGGSVVAREQAALAAATDKLAASTARYNALGTQQVETQAMLATTSRALTTAREAEAVATGAASAAMVASARATGLAATAMAAASRAAATLWAAIGGVPGAILIGLYAVYKLFIDQSDAIEAARRRTEEINTDTAKYAATLTDLSAEALKAAAAQERLNLAQLGSRILDAQGAVDRARRDNVNTNYGGVGSLGAGPKDAGEAAANLAKLFDEAAVSGARLNAITEQLRVTTDANTRVVQEKTKAFTKDLAVAETALARQRALNAASGASEETLTRISEAFALKAKYAAIDAEYTGEQAAALKGLAAALMLAERESRALIAAEEERIAMANRAVAGLKERQKLEAEMEQQQSRARMTFAELVTEAEKENARLAEQAVALGASKKAYEQVVRQQQVEIQVQAAVTAARKDGVVIDEEYYRQQLLIAAGLKAANEEAANRPPNVHPVKEAGEWAEKLASVLGLVQLIATAFGDVGKEAARAATGAQSILSGLAAAEKLKGRDGKTSIGLGTALSGAEGVASFASGLGAVGAVVGGFVQIADAIDLFGNRQKERAEKIRQAGIAFNEAIESFADRTGSSVDQAIQDIERRGAEMLEAYALALGFKDAQGASSLADIQAQQQAVSERLAKGFSGRQLMDGDFENVLRYRDALDKAEKAIRAKTAALEEQAAKELALLTENLEVRRLIALGLTDEAAGLQLTLRHKQEIDELEEKYGTRAATYIEALKQVQDAEVAAAEAARERIAAQKAEDERRSIFDYSNRTRAFTDPRAASQAAFDEEAVRRYNDAVERGAGAAELAAIQLYNLAAAADRAKQIAEQDLRTTEGLIARVLSAMGDARGAEDATLAASQRQAMADAIREGMSPGNLALLRFAQLAERSQLQMQRAIEDRTKAIMDQARHEIAAVDMLIEVTRTAAAAEIKAIDQQIEDTKALAQATAKRFDEQIAAVREQTKVQLAAIDAQVESARSALSASQEQVSALERQIQTNQQVVDALREFTTRSALGDLSTLSPAQKLAEARAQFDALAAAAQGGDATAATGIPAAATALLEASRRFNASGSGFSGDADRVRAIVESLTDQFGATLPMDQRQLDAAREAVVRLEQSLEWLAKQRDLIQSTSDAEIAVLQAAKDEAAENARAIIDKLQLQKDQISADAQATIDRLEQTKVAIQTAAEQQIEQLIKLETEAHLTRLRQDEYWQTFLGLTGQEEDVPSSGGRGRRTTATNPTPSTVPQDTLAEQRRANAQLEDLVRQQREEIDALKQQIRVIADAARDHGELLVGVRGDLATLNETLRRNGEGARV